MPFQSIKHHVYSLVGRWYFEPREENLPLTERSLIYGLPDDIVYYMACGMPIADQAAFAISCKAVWVILNGRNTLRKLKESSNHDRMAFLERLEGKMPHHCLCYQCKKFHRRNYEIYRSCDKERLILPFTAIGFYNDGLSYRRAKEIMNYHRFGPSHGSPFKEIVYSGNHILSPRSYDYGKAKSYIDILCSARCREVRGNLVLKEDVWVTCALLHQKYVSVAWGFCCRIGDHFDPDPQFIGEIAEQTCWAYRCPLTRSERRIQVSFPRDRPGYAVFRNTIWQNLGTCRNSPTGFWTIETKGFPQCEAEHESVDLELLVYPRHFDDGIPSRTNMNRSGDFSV